MQSGGILKKHKLDSWAASLPKAKNIWTSVTVMQVSPLLIILIGGVLASILLLFIELAVKFRQTYNSKRRIHYPGKLYVTL
jgi:hypothetical protein